MLIIILNIRNLVQHPLVIMYSTMVKPIKQIQILSSHMSDFLRTYSESVIFLSQNSDFILKILRLFLDQNPHLYMRRSVCVRVRLPGSPGGRC